MSKWKFFFDAGAKKAQASDKPKPKMIDGRPSFSTVQPSSNKPKKKPTKFESAFSKGFRGD